MSDVTIGQRRTGGDQQTTAAGNTFLASATTQVGWPPPAGAGVELRPRPAQVNSVPLRERVSIGAFVFRGLEGVPGSSGDPWDPEPHLALERQLGFRLNPVSVFIGWPTAFGQVPFQAYGDRDLLISWHPDSATADGVLSGRYDAYLDGFAGDIARYRGGRVHVRLMPEMNGSWTRWSPRYPGGDGMGINSARTWRAVYRYIVTRCRRVAGSAIRWVWCPNITDYPLTRANRMEAYYPGGGYVDILGFDGYNWGDGQGFRWTSFHDLVGAPQAGAGRSIYDRLRALSSTKPIWICETGCADPHTSDPAKARWISEMLTEPGFPMLKCVTFFSIAKERDWRIDSSLEALAALRQR